MWVESSTKETMYDRERWLNAAGTLRVLAAKTSWVLIWCEGAANMSGALARTHRNSCLRQYTTMKTENKQKTLTIANNPLLNRQAALFHSGVTFTATSLPD